MAAAVTIAIIASIDVDANDGDNGSRVKSYDETNNKSVCNVIAADGTETVIKG